MDGTWVEDADTWASLLDAMPDPVLVVDRDAVVRRAMGSVSALLGWDATDLVGRPVSRVVPSWPTNEDHAAGRSVERHEALHADGRAVPLECYRIALADGVTAIFLRDLTPQLRLERENDRLADVLIASVSHELRTPLTSVVGYAELLGELDDTELGPMARRLVTIVHRNAVRELQLVDDLLAVSFDGDHLARMSSDIVDLSELVREVVADRQPFAEGAGLTLRTGDLAPAPVRGDAHYLARAVEQLLTSACSFSPPGGDVHVCVTTGPGTVSLSVTDTGIGISEDEAGTAFDRLYRAPGSVARLREDVGLGLTIAKAVIEAHRGTMELQSRVGAGTTVRVTLPRGPG